MKKKKRFRRVVSTMFILINLLMLELNVNSQEIITIQEKINKTNNHLNKIPVFLLSDFYYEQAYHELFHKNKLVYRA